jgi:hypothetical protein
MEGISKNSLFLSLQRKNTKIADFLLGVDVKIAQNRKE